MIYEDFYGRQYNWDPLAVKWSHTSGLLEEQVRSRVRSEGWWKLEDRFKIAESLNLRASFPGKMICTLDQYLDMDGPELLILSNVYYTARNPGEDISCFFSNEPIVLVLDVNGSPVWQGILLDTDHELIIRFSQAHFFVILNPKTRELEKNVFDLKPQPALSESPYCFFGRRNLTQVEQSLSIREDLKNWQYCALILDKLLKERKRERTKLWNDEIEVSRAIRNLDLKNRFKTKKAGMLTWYSDQNAANFSIPAIEILEESQKDVQEVVLLSNYPKLAVVDFEGHQVFEGYFSHRDSQMLSFFSGRFIFVILNDE